MVLALQPSAATTKPAPQPSPQAPPASADSAQQAVSSLDLPPLITGASFSSPVLHDPLSPTFREVYTAAAVFEASTLERQLTASTATPAKLSPADDAEPGLDLRAPRPSSGMDALRRLAEGDCLDSESDDGDWEMRVPRPEGEEGPAHGASDDEFSFPMRHCVNCTNKMPEDVPVCDECGHDMAADAALVSADVPAEAVDDAMADNEDAPTRTAPRSDATVLCYDERMTEHEEGKPNPHPERPDRIRAVMARLKRQGLLERVEMLPCREATREEITACHVPELVDAVEQRSLHIADADSEIKTTYFTPDTYVNPHTYQCAKLSAGGCVTVTEAVVRGEARQGVAVVRPPGHHAESNTAMGFCFFNNAAIAARAAQAAGAKKIIIFDWDVHHGNGTQHIFYDDKSVLYMSIHRHDMGRFYPGTGHHMECGVEGGEGFTVNVPWLEGGMTDGDYLAAMQQVILPIAYEYAPDLLIVSAGFDAAVNDPIGGCFVTPQGFAHMTSLLMGIAPMVVLLEGGYNLDSTSASVEAVMRVLLGEPVPRIPRHRIPTLTGALSIKMAIAAQASHWRSMFLAHNIQAPEAGELEAAAAEAAAAAEGMVDSDEEDERAALRAEVEALQAEAAEMAGGSGELGRRRRVPVGSVKPDPEEVKTAEEEAPHHKGGAADDAAAGREDAPAANGAHHNGVEGGEGGDHHMDADATSGGVGQQLHAKRRKMSTQGERYKWELLNALHYSALVQLHRKSEERRHSLELPHGMEGVEDDVPVVVNDVDRDV